MSSSMGRSVVWQTVNTYRNSRQYLLFSSYHRKSRMPVDHTIYGHSAFATFILSLLTFFFSFIRWNKHNSHKNTHSWNFGWFLSEFSFKSGKPLCGRLLFVHLLYSNWSHTIQGMTSFLSEKSTSEGVLVQFFGKGNTIMGRMIMCQMAIHLTVMIIVDVCVGMVGVKWTMHEQFPQLCVMP